MTTYDNLPPRVKSQRIADRTTKQENEAKTKKNQSILMNRIEKPTIKDIYPGLNDITDALESLPYDLIRYFTLLKEIDAKCVNTVPFLKSYIIRFLQMSKKHPKREILLSKIRDLIRELMPCLEEKMHVATIASDTVNTHLQRIDQSYKIVLEHEISEDIRIGPLYHPSMKVQEQKSAQTQRSESRREALAAKKANQSSPSAPGDKNGNGDLTGDESTNSHSTGGGAQATSNNSSNSRGGSNKGKKSSSKDAKDSKDSKDSKDLKDSKDSKDSNSTKDITSSKSKDSNNKKRKYGQSQAEDGNISNANNSNTSKSTSSNKSNNSNTSNTSKKRAQVKSTSSRVSNSKEKIKKEDDKSNDNNGSDNKKSNNSNSNNNNNNNSNSHDDSRSNNNGNGNSTVEQAGAPAGAATASSSSSSSSSARSRSSGNKSKSSNSSSNSNKKKQEEIQDVLSPSNGDFDGEPVYCYCQQVSYGEMVGCDGANCKREWFHLPCIGLKELPRGEWYCDDCRVKMQKRR
ncbi:unnamed protein product [[Candida] boidinii]|uniref:Chromatin modification-related protein n=1 Tax=Candida boidinii TaxID=5477 RepID=A0A9W6SZ77_CANBO|nr:hypothetical protein B5S30_g5543 [[Candida] boidinii]GME69814.1 unnamed protein product [[Candida] boidinii]GMF98298.1 unnamed protein product [[Candida] boidinii]